MAIVTVDVGAHSPVRGPILIRLRRRSLLSLPVCRHRLMPHRSPCGSRHHPLDRRLLIAIFCAAAALVTNPSMPPLCCLGQETDEVSTSRPRTILLDSRSYDENYKTRIRRRNLAGGNSLNFVEDEARHLGGRKSSSRSSSKSKSESKKKRKDGSSSKKSKKKSSSHRRRSRSRESSSDSSSDDKKEKRESKRSSSSSSANIFKHKRRKRRESGGSHVKQQDRPNPSDLTAVDSDVSSDFDGTMPSTSGSSVDDGPYVSPGRPDVDPNDPDGPDLVPSIPNDAGGGTDENTIRSDPVTDPLHPFSLRTFGSSVLGGYSSCAELASDVENAVRHVANTIILANADGTYSRSRERREGIDGDDNFDSQDADVLEDLDARFGYGTRIKQEEGVDEVDVVKTDGRRHVYVAYGNKVLVWDQRQQREGRDGGLLSEIEVPRVTSDDDEGEVDPWAPLPNVEGVMLPERDRLVVIVTGYGRSYPFDDLNQPILSDNGAIHAISYDVSDPSEPYLIHRKRFDGTYIAARSVDSRVYIITSSAVQPFFHLVQYLERERPRTYQSMSRTEYVAAATEMALQQLPGFVDRLVNETISSGDTEDDCRNIVRLSLFQTGSDGGPISKSAHKKLSRGKGIVESLVRISSFDVEENNSDGDHRSHQSMIFLPTHFADIFAANKVVVIPAEGYTYDRAANRWDQSTMLVSFSLRNDGPALAMGVGQMLGHPINRYAMAEHQGFLFVATRTRYSFVCNATAAAATDEAASGSSCKEWVRVSEQKQHIELLEFPRDFATNTVLERTGWISDFGDMEEIMYSVRFIGAAAFITPVNQTGPFLIADLSNTTNPYMVGTLSLPALSNQLHSVGQEGQVLAVGEDIDESTGLPIGIRFSYVDLTDDMSDPREIHNLVESMPDEQRGVQVLYDYRNSIYLDGLALVFLPTSITSYNAEGEGEFFRGFRVYEFDVDNGIEYKFSISHSDDSEDVWRGCFSDARVQARALVDTADKGGGDLFTVNMHSAIMVDTSAKDTIWSINFDADRSVEEMCYSY